MSAEPNATPAPSVSIVRMAPGDQRLTFEFSAGGSAAGAALFANVRLLTSGEWDRYPCRGESATIAPLLNGADYEIRIDVYKRQPLISRTMLLRCLKMTSPAINAATKV